MNHILLLNAPPQAGKDEAARYLAREHQFKTIKFAQPIRDAACDEFGLSDEDIDEWKLKDIGNGKVGRDFMIAYSECYIKPLRGIDYFGAEAAYRISERHLRGDRANYVVSDAGFDYEVIGFMRELEYFVPGQFQIHLIHLYRIGCTFIGDSRSRIFLKQLPPIQIHNNDTLECLYSDLDRLVFDLQLQSKAA